MMSKRHHKPIRFIINVEFKDKGKWYRIVRNFETEITAWKWGRQYARKPFRVITTEIHECVQE